MDLVLVPNDLTNETDKDLDLLYADLQTLNDQARTVRGEEGDLARRFCSEQKRRVRAEQRKRKEMTCKEK